MATETPDVFSPDGLNRTIRNGSIAIDSPPRPRSEVNRGSLGDQTLPTNIASDLNGITRPWDLRALRRLLFSKEGREIRRIASIVLRTGFVASQIGGIVIVLSLSGTVLRSTQDRSLTEWQACNKPLGIWSLIWAVRGLFSLAMNVWEWKRYWQKRVILAAQIAEDLERSRPRRRRNRNGQREIRWLDEDRTRPSSSRVERAAQTEPRTEPQAPVPTPTYPPTPSPSITASPTHTPGTLRRDLQPEIPTPQPERTIANIPLSSDGPYERADTLLTTLAIMHFVGNHILLYTSVHSCLVTSPHIWWLAFGVVCLGYVIVLELLAIAFIIFVLGPLLLLILNLLMLCFGRQYDRHGNTIVRAEIPKLDKKKVDKIPLVVYVPPITPEELEAANLAQSSTTKPKKSDGNKRMNFKFLSKKNRNAAADMIPWAKNFTRSEADPRYDTPEHPFVVLEGNMATCPICLENFVEPKRKEGVPALKAPEALSAPLDIAQAEETTESEGNPGEPLRLLACGHVFHRHCLDTWLSTVSGRCPFCNLKVEFKSDNADGNV